MVIWSSGVSPCCVLIVMLTSPPSPPAPLSLPTSFSLSLSLQAALGAQRAMNLEDKECALAEKVAAHTALVDKMRSEFNDVKVHINNPFVLTPYSNLFHTPPNGPRNPHTSNTPICTTTFRKHALKQPIS